ncbi:SWIM zinc finger family protein [Diplocloster agilis]|uniref:SWIM zinc finger family protein n=1 Tax=Diplocloster agilis TaxID=2850323 RepID=A0A949NDE2_9FIRM|nr:SWIM zinc finger family protein [Diplocloster agilis]MBU9735049.1 SWIM zinc finger family protein [Diplocloster agilis]
MSYYGYAPYVSVAEKRAKADRQIAKLKKKNPDLAPVLIEGNTIARSWWGKAWNRNLESYADYANRISRGKSYVRNHAVLDLSMGEGCVEALVQGSRSKPYQVTVDIDMLDEKRWSQVVKLCNHRIDSVEKLVEGKFPKELEILFTERKYGMFPSPKEIHFSCSCPDYAYMCKHVAAVLYGVGARLDADPLLFFVLRGVDIQDLIHRSVTSRMNAMLKNAGKKSGRAMSEAEMHDVFGI